MQRTDQGRPMSVRRYYRLGLVGLILAGACGMYWWINANAVKAYELRCMVKGLNVSASDHVLKCKVSYYEDYPGATLVAHITILARDEKEMMASYAKVTQWQMKVVPVLGNEVHEAYCRGTDGRMYQSRRAGLGGDIYAVVSADTSETVTVCFYQSGNITTFDEEMVKALRNHPTAIGSGWFPSQASEYECLWER